MDRQLTIHHWRISRYTCGPTPHNYWGRILIYAWEERDAVGLMNQVSPSLLPGGDVKGDDLVVFVKVP